MSGFFEPSFLLELGAYAVAAAGIRIWKSKYWRAGTQPSADDTSQPEEPIATVQVRCRFSCFMLAAVLLRFPFWYKLRPAPKPACCIAQRHVAALAAST